MNLIMAIINNQQSEFSNALVEDNQLNFGLTVNSVGYKSILPIEKVTRTNSIEDLRYRFKKGKVTDEFKLVYIIRGTGYVLFDEMNEIEIHKGNILIIMPNQKYKYYHLNDTEWKEYFIRFEADPNYFDFIQSLFSNNQILDVGFNEELIRLFQRTVDVVKNGLKSSQVYLSGMLLHVLGLAISEFKNNAIQKRESQIIEQAKIMLNENIFADLNLQEIADKLNLSYTSFRKKFKENTGLAPAKYFNELRLNKSKELLTETTNSIKEISFLLRFASVEHFATIFKKTTGRTPKEFRMSGKNSNVNSSDI